MKPFMTMLLFAAVQFAYAMQISLPEKTGTTILAAKKELQDFLGSKKDMPDFILHVDKTLPEEAWKINRKSASSIRITGGSPRGVYYGVIEFLERFRGIRFYGPEHTYIPAETADIPANIDLTGEPSMRYRMHSVGYEFVCNPNTERWYGRNRIGAPGIRNRGFFAYGSPNRCHTYGIYTNLKDFPDDITCHALLDNGTRAKARNGVGPGQPCTTNPKVREYFKRKLREFILSDREKAKAKGAPAPQIYNVSANDNFEYCRCKNCKEAWKRTGGPGGNDLDFVNYLAKSIEKDFPEITLECFAYMYSERPDKIKAHPQVQVQLAQLGGEYQGKRRTMLSLLHPENAESLADLRAWPKFAKKLAIWDYCNIYNEKFPSPYTKVRCYSETLKEYYACGVRSLYAESELASGGGITYAAAPQSFCDLKNYTVMRFMIDKNTDVEALINDYMLHTYGPAAESMKKLLALIEKGLASEKNNMNRSQTQFRKYMNKEFFLTAEKLLTEAEKAVAGDPVKLKFVQKERFQFDYGMLGCYNRLKKDNFPIKAEDIAARLEPIENWIVNNTYYADRRKKNMIAAGKKRRDALLKSTQYILPSPPDFLKNSIIAADFSTDNFKKWSICEFVDDPDSFNGKTFQLGQKNTPRYKDIHKKPFELGLYDAAGKRFIAAKYFKAYELPQDEKYHWHVFKNVTLSSRCRMWGHASWALTPVPNLEDAFDLSMPSKRFDVWISYKVTGPAYVKNSTKPNTLSVNRVVVALSEKQKNDLPDFLKERKVAGYFHMGNFDKNPNVITVTDPDAYGYQAMALGPLSVKGQLNRHQKPFELGVYDNANKKFLKQTIFRGDKIPQDEKYHWHIFKNVTLSKKCRIWGDSSWALSPVKQLEKAFDPARPQQKYDICISYKLTGPAYVKGSKKDNMACIDRVIVVESLSDK